MISRRHSSSHIVELAQLTNIRLKSVEAGANGGDSAKISKDEWPQIIYGWIIPALAS